MPVCLLDICHDTKVVIIMEMEMAFGFWSFAIKNKIPYLIKEWENIIKFVG